MEVKDKNKLVFLHVNVWRFLYIQSVHNLTDTHTYASYCNITHKLTSVTYVLFTY
jgi:hypothetical protein